MQEQRNIRASVISAVLTVFAVGIVFGGWAALAVDAESKAGDSYSVSDDYASDDLYVAAGVDEVTASENGAGGTLPDVAVLPEVVSPVELDPVATSPESPANGLPVAMFGEEELESEETSGDNQPEVVSTDGEAQSGSDLFAAASEPDEYVESYPGELLGLAPIPAIVVPPTPTPLPVPVAVPTATGGQSNQPVPATVPPTAAPASSAPTQVPPTRTPVPLRPTPTPRPPRPTRTPPTPTAVPPTVVAAPPTSVPPATAPPSATATPRPRPIIVTGSS